MNAAGLARGSVTAAVWDTEKPENILWKTEIPGLGHSSPIIWGDRLFVTTAVNQKKAAALKVGAVWGPGFGGGQRGPAVEGFLPGQEDGGDFVAGGGAGGGAAGEAASEGDARQLHDGDGRDECRGILRVGGALLL